MTSKTDQIAENVQNTSVQNGMDRSSERPARRLRLELLEARIAPATNLNSSKSNYP